MDIAALSWVRVADTIDDRNTNSLFISRLMEGYQGMVIAGYRDQFPLGPPVVQSTNYFLLEDAINWIDAQLPGLPRPFLGYFHLLPPHDKYRPRSQDYNRFQNDGQEFDLKNKHLLANRKNGDNLTAERKVYDEYILYVDAELGRLYNRLDEQGILDETWLVLTSDHGESFERGILGHKQDTFHQPIVRIPLLIFEPGQQTRRDVYQTTTAIDLLPTLLKITGHSVPEEIEGKLLPPFDDGKTPNERTFYAGSWAESASVDWDLRTAVMMINERYKLIRYEGYKSLPGKNAYYELYNLEEDPEEMVNLFSPTTALPKRLAEQLDEIVGNSIARFPD